MMPKYFYVWLNLDTLFAVFCYVFPSILTLISALELGGREERPAFKQSPWDFGEFFVGYRVDF